SADASVGAERAGITRNISSHRLGYNGNAGRTKSFGAATVSTPAKPPPATTKVSNAWRSVGLHSEFASSRWRRIWARNRIASESDFIGTANSAIPGRL